LDIDLVENELSFPKWVKALNFDIRICSYAFWKSNLVANLHIGITTLEISKGA